MNTTTQITMIFPKATRQTTRVVPLLATTLFVLLSATAPGWSQTAEADEPAGVSATSTPGYTLVITDGKLLHNGRETEATLKNVVDYLRERHPEANIVIGSGVPRTLVGDVKLRATSIEQELEAIRVASGERFEWKEASAPAGRGIDPVTGLPLPGRTSAASTDQMSLYVLGPTSAPTGLRVEAFHLSGYLASARPEGGTIDEIIDEHIEMIENMVDETIQVYAAIQKKDGYGSSPSLRTLLNMRFHRGANLLVVIGDPATVEIAAKVIGALPNVQRTGPPAGRYGGAGYTVPNPYGASRGADPFDRAIRGEPPGSYGRGLEDGRLR